MKQLKKLSKYCWKSAHRSILCWQLGPVNPASQLHRPVTPSQLPSPFLQSHVSAQSAPQCPASQTATKNARIIRRVFKCLQLSSLWPLPFLQSCPVHPGAQVHCPFSGSQRALFSHTHFIWHLRPKRPLGQATWEKKLKNIHIYIYLLRSKWIFYNQLQMTACEAPSSHKGGFRSHLYGGFMAWLKSTQPLKDF